MITWEAFRDFVANPQVVESKDTLEGWSPAKFRENRRGLENAEALSAVVLDDDKSGLSIDEVDRIWFGFGGIVHTTHSHTDAAPKYRIVLRLSRDITPAEYSALWRVVREHAALHGQVLDAAPKDPSRLWYVPAHRAGAPYASRLIMGPPLDVDEILAGAPDVERRVGESRLAPASGTSAAEPGRLLAATQGAGARRNAMAAALGAAWPARGNGRHEAQLALAGALRGEGLDEAEAVDFLCAVCRAAGDEDRPKREATVRHTYARGDGEALTGWTRLKAFVDPVVVDAARTALGRNADWTENTARRLAEAAVMAAPRATAALKLPTADKVTIGRIDFDVGGFDADLPPIAYQVDGVIARGEVVMFVAHGNSLKTWLGLSMSHAIATGRPWLGKYVTTRGRAAIIDFESGRYEILRRMKLLGVRDAEVEDRLLRSSFSPAQLVDPETWIGLAGHGLEFILVDSFNAAAPDLDENDARAALMLQHAGRFAEATGCTVVFVHHSRKGSGGDRREAVRGSTALFAACDRIFEFADLEKREGGVVLSTMQSVKDGAGRAPADVRVELSDQGLRWVETKPEEQAKPKTNRELAIGLLKANPAGVPQQDLVNIMTGKRESRFTLLSQLKLEGLVVDFKSEGKVFVMLRPGIDQ